MCEGLPWDGLSEDVNKGESYVTECAYGGSACPTGEDRDMHGDSGRAIWNYGG